MSQNCCCRNNKSSFVINKNQAYNSDKPKEFVMDNKVVGFSSVNEDELMNVDGGILLDTVIACLLWGFIFGADAYLFKKAFSK